MDKPSRLRRGSRLYRLFHGDDEGSIRVRKGTILYSFDEDRFRFVDNEGVQVYFTDHGMGAEQWAIREGWIIVS